MARPLPCILVLAGALVSIPPASPAEPPRPIPPEAIAARDFKADEARSITGKYQELTNQELRLFDVEARLVLADPSLARALLELKPQKDNLTVTGRFRGDGAAAGGVAAEPLPTFVIEGIAAAPSDETIFTARIGELLGKPAAGTEEFLGLAQAIARNRRRFGDPALTPLARQAFSEYYVRAETVFPPEDADGRLALIRKIHESLGDEAFTMQLLRVQARRYKDHAPTAGFLGELRCYQMDGEWYAYPEFKKRLGFLPSGDRWIKPVRKELEETVEKLRKENETNLILRTKTDREYALLARSGKVERGMTREEVSDALGLPDRVQRISLEGLEVDQWIYENGRIYFLKGQAALKLP